MSLAAPEIYKNFFLEGLTPDPILTVSEWADRYRVLTSESASEIGRWQTSRTPYLRDIMDALSTTSPYQEIVLKKRVANRRH